MAYCALLDANVLHPIMLCDLLLRLAERGFFRPLWSRQILDETTRSVARRFPGVDRGALDRRVAHMEQAFPEAMVVGHEALVPTLSMAGDSHVVAAAIVGNADVIVTDNVRHFPEDALARYRLTAQTADDFLIHQWWLDPGMAARVIVEQSGGTRNPHIPVADLLQRLSARVPTFADLARRSPEMASALR